MSYISDNESNTLSGALKILLDNLDSEEWGEPLNQYIVEAQILEKKIKKLNDDLRWVINAGNFYFCVDKVRLKRIKNYHLNKISMVKLSEQLKKGLDIDGNRTITISPEIIQKAEAIEKEVNDLKKSKAAAEKLINILHTAGNELGLDFDALEKKVEELEDVLKIAIENFDPEEDLGLTGGQYQSLLNIYEKYKLKEK